MAGGKPSVGVHRREWQRWLAPTLAVVGLAATIALAVVGTSGGPSGPPARLPPPQRGATGTAGPLYEPTGRPFAADSVWNRRVDGDTQLDPSSDRLVAAFVAEVDREKALNVGPSVNFRKYSVPEYAVPASQPTVPVALTNPDLFWRRTLAQAFQNVPVPPDARPAPGTDGHLVIWQPSTDRMWEFWRFGGQPGNWHAAWGGAIDHVSTSPGYYTTSSWPGARIDWGASASSLPVGGGLMLISELQRHDIPHALAMALPFPRAGVWSWPAQRTDGHAADPDILPEGAHLRLDPKLNIDSLALDPTTAAIARAAQRYGLIVRDATHAAIALYAEDPGQYVQARGGSPYRAIWESETPTELLRQFPWRYLQVLPMHLCSDPKRACTPPPGPH